MKNESKKTVKKNRMMRKINEKIEGYFAITVAVFLLSCSYDRRDFSESYTEEAIRESARIHSSEFQTLKDECKISDIFYDYWINGEAQEAAEDYGERQYWLMGSNNYRPGTLTTIEVRYRGYFESMLNYISRDPRFKPATGCESDFIADIMQRGVVERPETHNFQVTKDNKFCTEEVLVPLPQAGKPAGLVRSCKNLSTGGMSFGVSYDE